MTQEHKSGWHFHEHHYPRHAWLDDRCPNPETAIPLPLSDQRVVRAMRYPEVSR